MSDVLAFHDSAFHHAQRLSGQGRLRESREILLRLIQSPTLPPSLASRINFLLAEVSLSLRDYSGARECLAQSKDESDSSDYHFLMGQSLDEESEGSSALDHYATAARLAPADGLKVAKYARSIAKQKSPSRGVRLMHAAYRSHQEDPAVVDQVVQGLVEQGRSDEAELVIAQALYRYPDDKRFHRIRERFRAQRIEDRLFGGARGSDGPHHILEYRNLALRAFAKPGSPKRPNRGDDGDPPKASRTAKTSPRGPVTLEEQLTSKEVLRRRGPEAVDSIYSELGLLGKADIDSQSAEISAYFADQSSLESLVKTLPPSSLKLLKTLVRAGGYLPASTLFQTTRMDAPPPDYAQPLLRWGLLHLGKPARGRTKMVAVIPVDLLARLARVLKVRVGE